MYEDQTQETILKRMLGRVSSALDKREGSVIYDACAPMSIEAMLLYAMCDFFLTNTFGDTAERPYLVERAKERGLEPYPATAATVKVTCTPSATILPMESRFSYDDVNYRITSRNLDNTYQAECEAVGTVGNKPAGQIIPIDYIRGLQRAEVTEITVPGEDEEETEAFRKRYLDSFETSAYGGNIVDYQIKVNEIEGVGGVKVYPVWDGGGTVKIIFMTAEYKPPTKEFVAKVQEAVDPVPYAQKGVGIAPIGHRVTVQGVTETKVNVGLHITFLDEGTFEGYKDDISKTISTYLQELNKTWQDTEVVTTSRYENKGLTVRISQIESRLLQRPYVSDISHTTLNGKEENLELSDAALATLGEVTNG